MTISDPSLLLEKLVLCVTKRLWVSIRSEPGRRDETKLGDLNKILEDYFPVHFTIIGCICVS